MLGSLLAFCAVAALLTITPGADTALVLRANLAGGPRTGIRTGVGVCCGLFVWGAAAGLGVTALLSASTVGYNVLRIAGAIWLIALGIQAWRARGMDGVAGGHTSSRLGIGFANGMISNLLNPKVGIFYLSFLPQFIPPGVPTLPWTLLLTAIHAGMGILWFLFLSILVSRARVAVDRAAVRRGLQRVCGTVLIGFGIRLAIESR